MSNSRPSIAPSQSARAVPRWLQVINLAIYLVAIATIAVVVNYFASRPDWRLQIDATKTRAYSLSEQTRQMLASLPGGTGSWTIAMVVSESEISRSTRKQIDEVLRRYTDTSPKIRVLRIDPNDPRTLAMYETLLRDLQNLYKDDVAKYDAALDAGTAAFDDLQVFAQQRAPELAAIVQSLPKNEPSRSTLEQVAGYFALLSEQGQKVIDELARYRGVSENQPIPDYAGAQATLVSALSGWAQTTDAAASVFRTWKDKANFSAESKAIAEIAAKRYATMSEQLAIAADPLLQLPPLALSDIGRQLGQGEAAVILSPTRAAVIPSHQLFPKSNLRSTARGGVEFDQRFRGEQLLSAAIRSLTLDQMPRVVFVHAEPASLLTADAKTQADLTGVAAVLKTSRYDVAEWNVSKSTTPPEPQRGQRTVWVIVPPPPARSIEATQPMRALYAAADELLSAGENVLLSVYPSLLAKYGQPDPFAALPLPFGIQADTGTLVLERTPTGQGESRVITEQIVQDFSDESPVGRAVDGQQARFAGPVPLRPPSAADSATLGANVTLYTIAAIEPSPTRWLETDWSRFQDSQARPDQQFTEPIVIAMAAERPSPTGAGVQRLIVVGSGGWMVTNIADPVVNIGGGRVALQNPGNHELMLASVAWLAGMDDLIAASPMSQEVSRLRGITPEVRTAWWWIIVAGVPLGCVLLGAGVWLWRRM